MTIPANDALALRQDELIELFTIDFLPIGINFTAHFCNEPLPLYFGRILYQRIPISITGITLTGNKPVTPTLKIGNVTGVISALVVAYSDMRGVQVTRRRTYGKYLDGQPNANYNMQFTPDVFYINRKVEENAKEVTFELTTMVNRALKAMIPRRQIHHSHCTADYRGEGCGYMGAPVADEYDRPTADPRFDKCGKRVSSCKLRFGNVLMFNGFPGVDAYDI